MASGSYSALLSLRVRMCVIRVHTTQPLAPMFFFLVGAAVAPNIVDEVTWEKTLQCALKTHPAAATLQRRRLHLTRFRPPSVSLPPFLLAKRLPLPSLRI